MSLYEHIFIARQDVSAQQVEQLTDAFKAVIEAGEGKVTMVENWGLRSLAYKIKKNRKGHYVRLNIDATPAAVAEMERQMRLNEDVLRFMTVKVAELDEKPAAILAKVRDDRRPGGGGRFGDRDRGDRPRRDRDDRPRRDAAPAEKAE